MAKVSVNLDDDLDIDAETGVETARVRERVRDMAAALPSVSKAKSMALRDAPRVQFSFTNVPKPISEAFAREAERRKLTKKELLYECLRAGGIDIPSTAEIDARRR